MNQVIFLLLAIVAALGIALGLNWNSWFGEEKETVTVAAGDAEVPKIADVRVREKPLESLTPGEKVGWRRALTPKVAAALQMLVKEGEIFDLNPLSGTSRNRKIHLDVLNKLNTGTASITIEDVKELAADGLIDQSLVLTIDRDRGIPVEALSHLVERNLFPAKFVSPLEEIANLDQPLVLQEVRTETGMAMLPTQNVYVLDESGREHTVTNIVLYSSTGESIELKLDPDTKRWVVPSEFDAPVQNDRMKLLCDVLGVIGKGTYRGSARHNLFGVEGEEGQRMILKDASGADLLAIRVGKLDRPDGTNFRMAGNFIRPIGSDHVFRIEKPMSALAGIQSRIWMDTRMADVEYADIIGMLDEAESLHLEFDDVLLGEAAGDTRKHTGERIRLVFKNQPVEKDETEVEILPEAPGQGPPPTRKWVCIEPEGNDNVDLTVAKVDGIARQLLSGRFEDFVAPSGDDAKFGFDEPFAVIELHAGSGQIYSLKIGAQVPLEADADPKTPRQRYVMSTANPRVGVVSEATIRGYQMTLESLSAPLVPPTAPGPGGAPGMPAPGVKPPRILPPKSGDGG